MAQRLETNCVLECLHLQCGFTRANSKALATIIRKNTTLGIIRIDVGIQSFVQEYQTNILELVHALRSNTTLKKFKFVSDADVSLDPEVRDKFASELQLFTSGTAFVGSFIGALCDSKLFLTTQCPRTEGNVATSAR